MSKAKAKAIRKELFKKGIPSNPGTYQRITLHSGAHQIIASPERRIYKALKRMPREKALETVARIQKPSKE